MKRFVILIAVISVSVHTFSRPFYESLKESGKNTTSGNGISLDEDSGYYDIYNFDYNESLKENQQSGRNPKTKKRGKSSKNNSKSKSSKKKDTKRNTANDTPKTITPRYSPNRETPKKKHSSDMGAQDRIEKTFEVGYNAVSFNDVKLTGSYGFSSTILPWEIMDNLYAGVHFSPINFNFGLVNKEATSDMIKLGPAIGYYFTPTIFVAMPVTVVCEVYFKDHDTKTAWGMSWAPSLYAGNNKFGLFAGPLFSISFEGSSKVETGFRAGLYFNF